MKLVGPVEKRNAQPQLHASTRTMVRMVGKTTVKPIADEAEQRLRRVCATLSA